MKIACTGANGYVGKALVCSGVFPLNCDVTNSFEVEKAVREVKPDIILHLAAKSDVDWCEEPVNKGAAIKVNFGGTRNVAEVSKLLNIPFVLFSTAQIWKGGFWERDHKEHAKKTPPVNVYGMTKLGAEMVAESYGGNIIRSSFIFDHQRLAPKLNRIKDGEILCEPTFIRRSFIYLGDFVDMVLQYCEKFDSMPKILHLAGSETESWYDFMYEVAKRYGLNPSAIRSRRREERGFAPRPHNAGLDTYLARSLGFRVPDYMDGIKRMTNEI